MGSNQTKEEPVPRREIRRSVPRAGGRSIRNFEFLDEASQNAEILVAKNGGVIARYPCHLEVLRAYIPALASECNDRGTILIERHGPEVVELVLRCAYQKPIRLDNWKCARDTLRMAKVYSVESLIKECKKCLEAAVTLGNVCYILETCIQYYLPDLEKVCLNLCRDAGFVVLKTNAFCEMPLQIVRSIASMPTLNVPNELKVFEALWNWAKSECAKRTLQLTEESILEGAFAHVSSCVGFEFMTKSQKLTLPVAVQREYAARITRNPRDQLGTVPIRTGRCLRLPHSLFNFGESITLKPEEPVSKSVHGTHITCVKFSLGVDTFLLGFVILCLRKDEQTGNPVETLKITTPTATLLIWEDIANEDYVKVVEEEGIVQHKISVYGEEKVTKARFVANTVLPVYAGVTYTLELESRVTNLQWPLVLPQWDDSKFDHNVTFYSDAIYGLQSVTFLKTS